MRETLTLRVSGDTTAPARARAALRSLERSLSSLQPDVDLLVSELVTNSVMHARAEQIELRAHAHPGGVRVEVSDPGPGFEASGKRERPENGDIGGYGLYLVDSIANRWGVATDDQARVWFEIDRRR